MKKNLSLLVLFAQFFVLTAYADLAPTVMLRHNGQAKYYMNYQIQNAVDEAVDGDTIYLSEGTFQPFNVNKRILVRGAGSTTMIEGDCEIDISGTAKLTMPVLDAMCFSGNVIVKSAYKQFTLRKCKMVNLIWDETNEFWDTKVTQCWFTNRLNLPNNVKEFNAFNSRIQVLYPHDYMGGQAKFEHCNIHEICDTIQGAIFNSCSLTRTTKLAGAKSITNLISCVLNSCLYHWNHNEFSIDNCTIENCCTDSDSARGTDYYDANTISALDGTPIGAYGGQHPFKLNPELPTVTQYQLGVDPTTKTMHVKLTVTKP